MVKGRRPQVRTSARKPKSTPRTPRIRVVDGCALRTALQGGYAALERHYEAVNALNVYPVPDGDTGINMLLTMQATLQSAPSDDPHIGRVAEAASRGALLGARGNAGVILSQFLRGMAAALRDKATADAPALAQAFRQGTEAAYRAVARPTEGTILTVMRATAEAVEAHQKRDVGVALTGGVAAAKDALARTPNLLPVLAEAGVVDAGGQGFVLILEGMLYALQGEPLERIPTLVTPPRGKVSAVFLQRIATERYGFCTQFIIKGEGLDADAIRSALAPMAQSTVVLGEPTLVRVHLHTFTPQEVLTFALRYGQVDAVRIEDMDRMREEFSHAQRQREPTAVGVVAVGWGAGIEELLQGLGAWVVRGGQTMNPSVQDLLEAIEALPAREVILLPNNPNIIVSGRQAVGMASKPVHLLPTRTIPQGIAALLSFNPEEDVHTNLARMEQAIKEVHTGEVVASTRTTRVNGQEVKEGELMGFLDGTVVVAGQDLTETVCRIVEAAQPLAQGLVTLYWGHQETQASADALAQALRRRFPGLQVEVVHGGQPFYPIILSAE
ncbi:MAG: DAK2 domain-containing protein [Dehalococcoidia bacterium]|nr:DAK2 domain-containing protein [Dehalococcoidia bacterium]MDW8119650.1 DAK2 domain-containing protein [Chloroflexota bacterium]